MKSAHRNGFLVSHGSTTFLGFTLTRGISVESTRTWVCIADESSDWRRGGIQGFVRVAVIVNEGGDFVPSCRLSRNTRLGQFCLETIILGCVVLHHF